MSKKEVRFEMKVKNNLLLSRMEECGVFTNAELCREIGEPNKQPLVGKLINMTKPARNTDGEWLPVVIKISEFLRCLPEDLFSNEQQESALETNRVTAEMSFAEIEQQRLESNQAMMPEHLLQALDLKQAITESMRKLTETEQLVLQHRFGLRGCKTLTLEQIGGIIGVTKSRVNAIEAKALRKLKHPAVNKPIYEAAMFTTERHYGKRSVKVREFEPGVLDALKEVK